MPIADLLGFILAETVWLSGLFTFVHVKHLKDKRIRDIKYATGKNTEDEGSWYYRDANYTTSNPANTLPKWG